MDDWRNQKLPERLPFSKKRLPKRVIFSYIFDYLIIFALLAFFVIVDKMEPFHQPFALDNYTLHYPFAEHERVTVMLAGLIGVIFPAAIIFLYTMIIDGLFSHKTSMPGNRAGLKRLSGRYRFKDRLWELNCGLLGLMLAVCAAFSITGSLKNAIGKPRPDLIARCNPDPDMVAELAKTPFKMATIAICRPTNNYLMQDGFKSFPSAHSSVSFAGLFYLSLYLAAKLHVLDSKGEVWKTVLVVIPTLAAALVAGSRIMDARHHPFDVITGSMLGLVVAWGSYRQYFPPVSETWRKGRAYPVRSWGREPQAPPTRVELDEDVRILSRTPTDLERGDASGFSSQATAAAADEHGGNVFRQQIHQSQRQRQQREPFDLQPSDTMSSTYSQKVVGYKNQLPNTNPFANQQTHDNYDYSSSEDEENYELQQRQQHPAGPAGAYNPVTGQLTSTGYYPPPGATPTPTPPPPTDAHSPASPVRRFPTGMDIGVRSDSLHAPSPPPHAVGTTTTHAI